MRILEINAYYNYGSTGHIVKDLCDEGAKHGHEMFAIYWLLHNSAVDSESVIYCGDDSEPTRIRKISQFVFNGGRLNYNIERTKKIIDCIHKINPDIIHLHNLHGDFEYGSLDFEMFFKALARCECRVIWTLHDCWPITGRCYYFSYKQCERWKTGCRNCPQRIFDREGILHDYSGNNWQKKAELYREIKNLTIVTVSNWLNFVVQESMLRNREIKTIYNGIDVETFCPAIQFSKKEKFQIVCVGWDRRKGYEDYYKLSKLLSDDEEIVVVGFRPIFRKFKRMPQNIREIACASSKEEMAQIYRTADVYFNASPAETFGLTTAEAMACGTPVIGYRNTATTELLEQVGGGNILVDNGNISQVKEAIERLRGLKVDKAFMHQRCVELFAHSRMVGEYMRLYSETL